MLRQLGIGQIGIQSKVGIGTTFDISLPYKKRIQIRETSTTKNNEPQQSKAKEKATAQEVLV